MGVNYNKNNQFGEVIRMIGTSVSNKFILIVHDFNYNVHLYLNRRP